MRITAITRYKQADLLDAMRRLNWTQAELARRSGVHQTTISNVLNLKFRPGREQATAIQEALAEAGEFLDILELWPESFTGLGVGSSKEETADVPLVRLVGCREAMQIAAPAPRYDLEELEQDLERSFRCLGSSHRRVLKKRFYEGQTLQETGRALGITRERVRQIELSALRRLRHPANCRRLKQYAH